MNTTVAVTILIVTFITLLVLRMPVTFALGISTVLTALYCKLSLVVVFQRAVDGIWSFSLLAIPFFYTKW